MRASAADRSNTLVRMHDVSGSQAVPERFRPVLSALIDMIAEGDVAAMWAHPAIRVGGGDPLLWVRDYPAAVTSLPPQGWDVADAMPVDGQPELWLAIIPLWTEAEGRSNLSLEATVEDRAEGPVVEVRCSPTRTRGSAANSPARSATSGQPEPDPVTIHRPERPPRTLPPSCRGHCPRHNGAGHNPD